MSSTRNCGPTLEDRISSADDPVWFAFDVTPNRASASIGVAGMRDDGLVHVEVSTAAAAPAGWSSACKGCSSATRRAASSPMAPAQPQL
jgi:hypothetical protein